MPGLRALDRYAVRCGGGINHRNDLGAGILIKENHIACAGGIHQAIRAARQKAPHTLRIECEVQTLDELREAIDAGAHAVLLDNMDDETLSKAVAINQGRVVLEASGGITLERLPRLAAIGVDIVSCGALTHSVKAADLSLLIRSQS
jgi:nicotinate-nucleotide pyrophosphorylase (carboxylating)